MLAAAGGTVVDIHDGEEDDKSFDPAELSTRETAMGGNYIIIDHGNGTRTGYAHLGRIDVKPGDRIEAGQTIALSGGARGMAGAGTSTGAHLHYEVFKNGRPVNPATVRAVGGEDALGKQERSAFNSRLRQLLSAGWKG